MHQNLQCATATNPAAFNCGKSRRMQLQQILPNATSAGIFFYIQLQQKLRAFLLLIFLHGVSQTFEFCPAAANTSPSERSRVMTVARTNSGPGEVPAARQAAACIARASAEDMAGAGSIRRDLLKCCEERGEPPLPAAAGAHGSAAAFWAARRCTKQ